MTDFVPAAVVITIGMSDLVLKLRNHSSRSSCDLLLCNQGRKGTDYCLSQEPHPSCRRPLWTHVTTILCRTNTIARIASFLGNSRDEEFYHSMEFHECPILVGLKGGMRQTLFVAENMGELGIIMITLVKTGYTLFL